MSLVFGAGGRRKEATAILRRVRGNVSKLFEEAASELCSQSPIRRRVNKLQMAAEAGGVTLRRGWEISHNATEEQLFIWPLATSFELCKRFSIKGNLLKRKPKVRLTR